VFDYLILKKGIIFWERSPYKNIIIYYFLKGLLHSDEWSRGPNHFFKKKKEENGVDFVSTKWEGSNYIPSRSRPTLFLSLSPRQCRGNGISLYFVLFSWSFYEEGLIPK
jgi:hypothetical protein